MVGERAPHQPQKSLLFLAVPADLVRDVDARGLRRIVAEPDLLERDGTELDVDGLTEAESVTHRRTVSITWRRRVKRG
ncbi:hypothetical protein [Cognatiluteimonas profundi]|uniref:hypothetical protein n=1 Tax=Cognatiluteimonas profundi TaxID=2594501 RepID=UPI001E36461D|nr:hypothetical protein [Lysobacter profundi]